MALKIKKNPFKIYFPVTEVAVDANDPCFIKQRNDAIAHIKKYGLPKQLTKARIGFELVWNEEKREWDFVRDEVN